MKTVQKLKIFSLLMAMPLVTNADLDCPPGLLFNVDGFTATNSLPPSLLVQYGSMHLELRKHPLDRDPKYEFDCALTGVIVGQTATGQQLLNHTMICPNDSFNTIGDLGTVTGSDATQTNPPSYYDITEVISTIVRGTGLFTNMSGVITATGRANLTPPFNNDFTLSGEVCLKKEKK